MPTSSPMTGTDELAGRLEARANQGGFVPDLTLLFGAAAALRALQAERDEALIWHDKAHHFLVERNDLAIGKAAAEATIAKQAQEIAALREAAQDVLDETDKMLVVDPPPIKYRAPYGTLAKLRGLLRARSLANTKGPEDDR